MTRQTRRATANSTYPKGGVSFSKDSFMVNHTFVFQIKFCGKSPALRVAANRWLQLDEKREETKRSSIVVRAKMQRHEKEERDRKQAATNNMYSLCNELF
jgi:hypothetical protein